MAGLVNLPVSVRIAIGRWESLFTSVAWSPDGQSVAAGGTDGVVWVWRIESGESMLLEGHAG
jgi:WD40 repeat protein